MTHKASVLRYAPLAALIGTAGRAALSGRGPTAAHGARRSAVTTAPRAPGLTYSLKGKGEHRETSAHKKLCVVPQSTNTARLLPLSLSRLTPRLGGNKAALMSGSKRCWQCWQHQLKEPMEQQQVVKVKHTLDQTHST